MLDLLCSITQCAVKLGGKGYLKTKWRFQVAFAVFTLLMGVFHQERPVVGVLPGQGVGGNV